MVEQQIRPWEVLDQDVLDLLMTVKREEFVPAAYVAGPLRGGDPDRLRRRSC
jgi:protein-L-isoaspartate O-methyltransferase